MTFPSSATISHQSQPVLHITSGNTSAHCDATLRDATLHVAEQYYGSQGLLGYALFEAVNTHLFNNELPWPWVEWSITAHGKCLGQTHIQRRPRIELHPSLLGGTEKERPWQIPPSWLGVLYALDVVVHECCHVAVEYVREGGRQDGETSHNNLGWVAEVNRVAPLLGLHEMTAGVNKVTRQGKTTKRVSSGSVPFKDVTTFPHAYRMIRGDADAYYTGRRVPFPVALPPEYAGQFREDT